MTNHGVDINARNINEQTQMYIVAIFNQVSDRYGNTPIDIAARENSGNVLEWPGAENNKTGYISVSA